MHTCAALHALCPVRPPPPSRPPQSNRVANLVNRDRTDACNFSPLSRLARKFFQVALCLFALPQCLCEMCLGNKYIYIVWQRRTHRGPPQTSMYALPLLAPRFRTANANARQTRNINGLYNNSLLTERVRDREHVSPARRGRFGNALAVTQSPVRLQRSQRICDTPYAPRRHPKPTVVRGVRRPLIRNVSAAGVTANLRAVVVAAHTHTHIPRSVAQREKLLVTIRKCAAAIITNTPRLALRELESLASERQVLARSSHARSAEFFAHTLHESSRFIGPGRSATRLPQQRRRRRRRRRAHTLTVLQ